MKTQHSQQYINKKIIIKKEMQGKANIYLFK